MLEHEHWALIPQWQPARAILFVSFIAALLPAAAAMKASNFAERMLWLTAAFLMPVQHAFIGREIHWPPFLLAAALAVATTILYFRRETLVLAALIPFVAIPQSRLVVNYPRIETTDLRAVADWARNNTPPEALFLFPDAGTSLDPGIFRARALRGLYVDWKSGGQVNFFSGFAREWWRRWVETKDLRSEDFPKLKGVDYVVFKKRIAGAAPVFQNASYSVYPSK